VAAVIKVSLLLWKHFIIIMFWAAFGENCIFQEFTENSLLSWAVQKKKIPNYFFTK